MHRETKTFMWLTLLRYLLYQGGLEPNPVCPYGENILKCQLWLSLGYGITGSFVLFFVLCCSFWKKNWKGYMKIFDKGNKCLHLEELELLF